MTKRNDFIWKTIQVISWIIFAGYCVQTGALLFNYIFSLFKPIATKNLYLGLDLSDVYYKSKLVYTNLFSFIIILSALKAFVFYLIIRIFYKLNLVKPFSDEVADLISKISYYAFAIGLIGAIAHKFTKQLIQKGYEAGAAERFWDDSFAFFMMAAIVFVIALIFKKGIELQKEQELTV
jgi:magnesium-transporting ATPase (P-type)